MQCQVVTRGKWAGKADLICQTKFLLNIELLILDAAAALSVRLRFTAGEQVSESSLESGIYGVNFTERASSNLLDLVKSIFGCAQEILDELVERQRVDSAPSQQ